MNNMFDIENLFKYYSKSILKESNKQNLLENEIVVKFDAPINVKDKELAMKLKNENPKRFKTVVYYDNDPSLLPTSFQISYSYKVNFNTDKIREDYSATQLDVEKNLDIDDDEIEKMIQQQMKQKGPKIQPKKVIVNMDGFFVDVFKKLFPVATLNGRLNDLIRAGVLPMGDFKIYSIVYSTQVDDKLMYRHLETAIKQNKPSISIPYGYEIGFECKDKNRARTQSEIVSFALDFSKAMNGSIFKDTQYYTIGQKK